MDNKKCFIKGIRDAIPIALGYLAVSFSLGIAAKNSGLTAPLASLASLLCLASAGEFAGFTLIAASASYVEMAVMELVINIRYMLMSCAMSQKIPEDTSLPRRLLLGMTLTDEIFGISIAFPGKLNPYYSYGAVAVSAPAWTLGTGLGVIAGNVLPDNVVSALSVALYGMFIAIIIPPAKKNRVLFFIVLISMVLSAVFTFVPPLSNIDSGFRIIILTVVISLGAAVLFPIREEDSDNKE